MDLTLELFLMWPCSVVAAAMLDSEDPLFPRLNKCHFFDSLRDVGNDYLHQTRPFTLIVSNKSL